VLHRFIYLIDVISWKTSTFYNFIRAFATS